MTPATKAEPSTIPLEDTKPSKSLDGDVSQDLAEGSSQVRRKVDWILLPLLGFCYFLQFLDKQTLSYASLLGMLQDNNLHGTQFSWTASIFYFGYIFWSYPTMFLSVRLPVGKYLGLYTYHFSSAGWGFPILAAAALMRALRVRLTE
jgi:hypothetical protein